MAKPEHQWETTRHRARRVEEARFELSSAAGEASDTRREAFDLDFFDGGHGHVVCGLHQQLADDPAADDPDLWHAVACWLVARGQREMNLRGLDGRALRVGPIGPEDLGQPAVGEPRRLISLCPSNLEMVAALGAFERVIACESSSDWPPEVRSLERLGPDLGPNLDRVAELAPDLVVSSLTVPGMERNVTGLRARGIPQLVLAPRSLADVIAEVAVLGEALGLGDAAAEVQASMQTQIRELEERCEGTPLRVYLEWWPKPMFSPAADCYSNALIELAGGINVFGERAGASIEVSAEDVLGARPELCFVSWCGVAEDKLDPQRLIDRPGLESLDAARAGRVYTLDEQFSGRPGPRMLEAARIMQSRIEQVRRALG